jgi:hypothetical protein
LFVYRFENVMTEKSKLSSLEKILLGIEQPAAREVGIPLHQGGLCPHCRQARLDYNGLLQLACPLCNFTDGSEGGGCT